MRLVGRVEGVVPRLPGQQIPFSFFAAAAADASGSFHANLSMTITITDALLQSPPLLSSASGLSIAQAQAVFM